MYPAEYHGTEKIQNIVPLICAVIPEETEYSGDMIRFYGRIEDDRLRKILQNITKEAAENDIDTLAEIMESEFDREIDITVEDDGSYWKTALDKLRADAKKYSVFGLDIEADCSIDDEQLADENGFNADESIFYVSLNNAKYVENAITIGEAQNMLDFIHFIETQISMHLNGILENPEFRGQLVDTVEDFLTESGVTSIPSSEKEKKEDGNTDDSNAAIIYGSDYDNIADTLASIVANWINGLHNNR